MSRKIPDHAIDTRTASSSLLITVFGALSGLWLLAISIPALAQRSIPGTAAAGTDRDSAATGSAAVASQIAGSIPRTLGLALEVGAQNVTYHALSETGEFNPAADLMPPAVPGWEHFWQEKRVWVRIDYDAVETEHLLLQPGATLGAVQAEFRANNESLHFVEDWETRPGLLWGVSLAAVLRSSRGSGPFLQATYVYTQASAGERNESITSLVSRTNGQNRDAEFLWREREAFLGAGYQWRAVTAMAGGISTDLRLEKRLDYHIPETDAAIIAALNSVDSEYDFRNIGHWKPFCKLEWRISPAWAISASAKFGGYEDFTLALRFSL